MLVSRLFTTPEDAMAAVSDLRQIGFREAAIRVVDKPVEGGSDAAVIDRDSAAADPDGHPEAVSPGGTLVVVEAPPGASQRAAEILEHVRAGDRGTPHADYEVATRAETEHATSAAGSPWLGPTPLSTALNWPVLLHNPTPLSSYLNRPALSKEQAPKASLSNDATPLSSRIGMKLLSDKAAPLSSWLGMKLLSDDPTPLSTRINRKVLSDDPAPLSSWLGRKVLWDNPTPLSSWLGLKVLSDDPKQAPSQAAVPLLSDDKIDPP